MTRILLILLFSLIAPLPLLIIETYLPYPFLIEEIFNISIVFLLIGQERIIKRSVLPYVITSGLLFTLSESIFYLINILALQTYIIFFQRLLLTGSLHVGTLLLLYFFVKRKKYWWILGLLLAVSIHFFYNYLIVLL